MTTHDYTPGTLIYYTGDMANIEGFGEIVKRNESDRWGLTYNLLMEDGRKINGLTPSAFTPGPGRRFWLREEWTAKQRAAMEDMQRRYMKATI